MTTEDGSLIVEIERILPGGQGIAHAEGLTLFVPLTAPGDVVRVTVDRVKSKLGFATVKEIVRPSAVRVEPPCPYFGRCGGCDFQQLTYEAQLEAKVEIIRDCLHRIGHIETVPPLTIHPSPRRFQYRSRTNWQFDEGRRRLGYFEGGSHRVCDVELCAVLTPELEQVLQALRDEMRGGYLLKRSGEIDAVAGDAGVSVAPAVAHYDTIEVARSTKFGNYHFNASSFFQINHDLLEPLVAAALGLQLDDDAKSPRARGDRAVDLYCGVGLFTLPLARQYGQVFGIESNSAAIRFAKRNLQQAGLSNARFVSSRAGDWLKANVDLGRVDFLLLDPPRSGAEPGAIAGILELKPAEISYVACDPATLARDLKHLLGNGYQLDSLAAFDMFPQTHHVETVVHLSLNQA